MPEPQPAPPECFELMCEHLRAALEAFFPNVPGSLERHFIRNLETMLNRFGYEIRKVDNPVVGRYADHQPYQDRTT